MLTEDDVRYSVTCVSRTLFEVLTPLQETVVSLFVDEARGVVLDTVETALTLAD